MKPVTKYSTVTKGKSVLLYKVVQLKYHISKNG